MIDQGLTLALMPDVRAAADGDHAAFSRIVDATRNTVCSISLAILRDVDASQEVAQDVFLSVWRDLRKLRNPASFLPWIRQLARNRSHHVLRSKVRYGKRTTSDVTGELLEAAADPRPDALAAMVSEEDRRALADAISELPDRSREVVLLYYREGRSVRQVAMLLGMSDAAVKQRLTRARVSLRAALLDKVSETIRMTAPSAAFTAIVITAVSVGAPATAAAASLSTAKLLSGSLGAKAAAAGASAASGFIGAAAGMTGGAGALLFGARAMIRAARDDEEKRGIVRLTLVNLTVTIVFGVTAVLTQNIGAMSAAFLLMLVVFAITYLVWLPRIIQRRYAQELVEDPSAWRRHRRQRKASTRGFLLGAALGGGSLLVAWYLSRI